jgi:phosphoketolase
MSDITLNPDMADVPSPSPHLTRSNVCGQPIVPAELQRMQRYRDATMYLSAGVIYLRAHNGPLPETNGKEDIHDR